MSEHFAWPRLGALIRNEAASSYRSWAIGSAVVAGIMLLNAMAVARDADDESLYQFWFVGTLFAWGTIASSLSFADLHSKSKNAAYLLLPASALEKTLAPLLLTTIGLVAYLLVFMTVASLAIEGVNQLLFGRTNELFNPFEDTLWHLWAIPTYIVAQAFFFLGAAWFRSVHFLKTLLAIVIGAFALVVLTALAAWVAGFATIDFPHVEVRPDFGYWLFTSGPWLGAMLAIVWFVAVPIFCWYVAWLRVKETQVSHGV